jgi:heme exporter protein A
MLETPDLRTSGPDAIRPRRAETAKPSITTSMEPAAEAVSLRAERLECVRDDRVLFSELSFTVRPGEVLQIEGHNGSGKTSLLRILCGLLLPTQGQVLWADQPIDRVRSEYLARLSYLGHHNGIKGELSPLENLDFAATLSPRRPDGDPYTVLARLALRGFEDVPCRTLSAGQNRRVGLARLLITRSLLWVLDEPFSSLDRRGMRDLEAIFEEHVSHGGMVVLTTHHPVDIGQCKVQFLDLAELGEQS